MTRHRLKQLVGDIIGANKAMDECYSYGIGHGCDLDCPKLLRGECEVTDDVLIENGCDFHEPSVKSILDGYLSNLSFPFGFKILTISKLIRRIPRLKQ